MSVQEIYAQSPFAHKNLNLRSRMVQIALLNISPLEHIEVLQEIIELDSFCCASWKGRLEQPVVWSYKYLCTRKDHKSPNMCSSMVHIAPLNVIAFLRTLFGSAKKNWSWQLCCASWKGYLDQPVVWSYKYLCTRKDHKSANMCSSMVHVALLNVIVFPLKLTLHYRETKKKWNYMHCWAKACQYWSHTEIIFSGEGETGRKNLPRFFLLKNASLRVIEQIIPPKAN